jgi:hypothetical protein
VRATRVADILLAGQLGAAPVAASGNGSGAAPAIPRRTLSVLQLKEYAGQFVVPELDVVLSVAVDSTGLTIRPPSGGGALFRPASGETFDSEEELSVTFTRGRDRRITGFVLDAGRVRGLAAVRQTPGGSSIR